LARFDTATDNTEPTPRFLQLVTLIIGAVAFMFIDHPRLISVVYPIHQMTSAGHLDLGKDGKPEKKTPPTIQGCVFTLSLISQITLPELAPCGQLTAGCRASQSRIPPPVSIRQHSSVVDQESTELPVTLSRHFTEKEVAKRMTHAKWGARWSEIPCYPTRRRLEVRLVRGGFEVREAMSSLV